MFTPSTTDPAPRLAEARDLFGVDEAILGRVIAEALCAGADFADCFLQHRAQVSMTREDAVVTRVATTLDRGLGVRAVSGDRTGYAYSEDLDLPALRRAARAAAAVASGGGHREPVALGTAPTSDLYPTPVVPFDLAARLALLARVEAMARAQDPAVQRVVVTWQESEDLVLVATSEGALLVDRRPMGQIGLQITAERGGITQTNRANRAARNAIASFDEACLGELVRDAVSRTLILFEARRPPAGEMAVVLAPGASGILLHEAVGHGMEADFNRKGISIYATLLGERVAAPCVTIVDSALHPHERGALNFDDEGTAGERTVLVEDGIMRSYLHDRVSARHYGVAPTGSGRRESFRHAPMPRMRCTYMEAGPHDAEEIVRSVSRGIFAESFWNGQVQIGAGDFTFYLRNGWLIEDGRLTAPIKDVNVIGNGPEALSRITMVGHDLRMDTGGWTCGKDGQGVPVSQGMPTTLVSQLTVGGVDD